MSTNNCIRCSRPIPSGKEVWMRRKNKERVSLCVQCASEVRQTRKAKQAQRQPARPSGSGKPSRAKPASTAAPGPSSTVSIEGILILIGVTMVGAPLLGVVVALVGQLVYLSIAFPVLMGIAGGFIVGQGVRWGKMRESMVAAVFGLVLGLTDYGSYRYVEYRFLRNDLQNFIMEELEAEFGEADPIIANAFLDQVLLEETGQTGFLGVVLMDAQGGMSISHTRYGGNVNVGTALTWIYWLIEIVIVAGIPTYQAMEKTKSPFCEHHNRWYERETSLGSIDPSRAQEIVALLGTGEYVSFGKSLDQKAIVPGVQFFIEHCVGCEQSPPIMTMKSVKRSSRGRTSYDVMAKQTITLAQYEQILQGVRARGELGY